MTVHALEQDRHAVDVNLSVADLDLPEADSAADYLDDVAVCTAQRKKQRVQIRILLGP